MATIKDNRKYQAMTVAEADQLFMRMGRAMAILEKVQAAWKKKIADLTLQQDAELAPLVAEFKELEAELAAYMDANPSRFIQPRFHKVANVGQYGFKTDPAHVELSNKGKDVIGFALENGLADDLLTMKPTPDRAKIAAAIAEGREVAGAKLIPAGDVLKYTFLPGYIEQQLKG